MCLLALVSVSHSVFCKPVLESAWPACLTFCLIIGSVPAFFFGFLCPCYSPACLPEPEPVVEITVHPELYRTFCVLQLLSVTTWKETVENTVEKYLILFVFRPILVQDEWMSVCNDGFLYSGLFLQHCSVQHKNLKMTQFTPTSWQFLKKTQISWHIVQEQMFPGGTVIPLQTQAGIYKVFALLLLPQHFLLFFLQSPETLWEERGFSFIDLVHRSPYSQPLRL